MNNLYTVILFLLLSTSGTALYGQENQSNIDSLLAQRLSLYEAGQNYENTELAIVAATGAYPAALVSKSISGETFSFNFRTYRNITPERQDQIEQRIMVSVSGLQSVEIDNKHVSATFSNSATQENVLLFFKLFGYTNYEIKN